MSLLPRRRAAALASVLSFVLASGCSSGGDPKPSDDLAASTAVASDGPGAPTAEEEPTPGAPEVDEPAPSDAATPSETAADELKALVPGPDDVPPGLQLIGAFSGPGGADEVSSLSTNPEGAKEFLEANGFSKSYVAQYSNDGDGSLVTTIVARFADAKGAAAHFRRDMEEAKAESPQVPVAGLGQEAVSSAYTVPEGDVDEIYALRFRKGSTWWVVSTAAKGKADRALTRRLADAVLARAG